MSDSKILPFLKSWLFKKPLVAGFELTNRCNLHCPMCYWWREKTQDELSDEAMIAFFKKTRQQGLTFAMLAGGEPTLRPNLIHEAARIFPYTWVYTNGSLKIGIPQLANVFYSVSVDGTEKIHDKIRGKGVYKAVWNNFSQRSDCLIATTLSKINKNEVEKIVKEWFKTKVLGMAIEFTTPEKGNDKLWLDWKERDEIIERLLSLKKKYGSFILSSKKMLKSYRKKEVEQWSKKCPGKWIAICYAADGSIKKPCMIGSKSDCSKCGCWIPSLTEKLLNFDPETIFLTLKLMSSFNRQYHWDKK